MKNLDEILKQLSYRFNVVKPVLRFTHTRRGRYFCRRNEIRFPVKGSWRGNEATLIHEFAHHLHWHIGREGSSHGRKFKQCLVKVVKAFYGCLEQYPWHTEYRSVMAYGNKQQRKEEIMKIGPKWTQADKDHLHGLVQKHYPEVIEKHEGKAQNVEILKTSYKLKDLKAQCKVMKISYFNAMTREELIKAIDHHNHEEFFQLEIMVKEVKARYMKLRGNCFKNISKKEV